MSEDRNDMTTGEMPTRAPKGPEPVMLAGRYRALRRLGEGGMGSVWLAEDTKLDDRKVAIKVLPAVLAGRKAACRQVKQEALLAMRLAHPNIATVRAFEEEEGQPFLVMDYIDGEGLDDILAEKGKLTEEETLTLLGPVAAALDYAHSRGVVHRDVKPGNVMVRKDGTPFVLDFGIAREIQETVIRVTGKFSSGPLMYTSPEQLHGRAPKAAQDVYSFAALAYECLKGEPPFAHGVVEYRIEYDVPEPLDEGMVSEALREGVMAGLAKEPEKRPGTCAGVLGAGEAAKRVRAEREGEAEDAGRRKQEEARPVPERAKAECGKREGKAVPELELAGRKPTETAVAEVREEARARAPEATNAKESRRRAAGWAWFLAAVLFLAWVLQAVWGYGERNRLENERVRLERALQDALHQQSELERQRSQWEDKARKAAAEVEAAAVARQKLEQRQEELLESSRKQRKATAEAEENAKQRLEERLEAQRAELEREWEQREKARKEAEAARREEEKEAARREWEGAYAGAAREVALPRGVKMMLKWCPKGRFTMGSPLTEEGRHAGEMQHEVTLTRGFWMAETEVTQGQWKALMDGETVKDLAGKGLRDDTRFDEADGKGAITMRERWELARNADPVSRCGDLKDNVPVYNVSWPEAKEFCRRLTEKGLNEGWLPAGYGFRLPTEAEWEYACRAGRQTALPNGKDIRILGVNNAPALDDIAWYGGNSSAGFAAEGLDRGVDTADWLEKQYPGGRGFARLAKKKASNNWGLYDMVGNVWEWCEDEDAGYPTGAVIDYCKRNGSMAPGVNRILRGGSWNSTADYCRSAKRVREPAGYRNYNIGFRPVCSAERN